MKIYTNPLEYFSIDIRFSLVWKKSQCNTLDDAMYAQWPNPAQGAPPRRGKSGKGPPRSSKRVQAIPYSSASALACLLHHRNRRCLFKVVDRWSTSLTAAALFSRDGSNPSYPSTSSRICSSAYGLSSNCSRSRSIYPLRLKNIVVVDFY